MLVLQNSLTHALHFFESLNNKGFIFHITNSGLCNYFPTLVSYCSEIVEDTNVSAVKHDLEIVRHTHQCIATTTDFESMNRHDMRHRIHTSPSRRIAIICEREIEGFGKVGYVSKVRLKKKTNEAMLKGHSFVNWESIL